MRNLVRFDKELYEDYGVLTFPVINKYWTESSNSPQYTPITVYEHTLGYLGARDYKTLGVNVGEPDENFNWFYEIDPKTNSELKWLSPDPLYKNNLQEPYELRKVKDKGYNLYIKVPTAQAIAFALMDSKFAGHKINRVTFSNKAKRLLRNQVLGYTDHINILGLPYEAVLWYNEKEHKIEVHHYACNMILAQSALDSVDLTLPKIDIIAYPNHNVYDVGTKLINEFNKLDNTELHIVISRIIGKNDTDFYNPL